MPNKVTRLEDMSATGRFWFGLVFFLLGLMPMLGALDIGPLTQADINGPPWLGFVAGGVFSLAGITVWVGSKRPLISAVLGLMLICGLAAIGNWIAFGIGPRVCSGSIAFLWQGDLNNLGCRIPFGYGAIITNGIALLVLVNILQKAAGGPPRLGTLCKWTEHLFLLLLAPILLPLVLFLVLGVGFSVIKTRLSTGHWPRNEAFIKRMKARKQKSDV